MSNDALIAEARAIIEAAADAMPGLLGELIREGRISDRTLAALKALADALEKTALRTISTITELDALLLDTVFITNRGAVWEVIGDVIDGTEIRYSSTLHKDRYQSKTFDGELPATILYTPPLVP